MNLENLLSDFGGKKFQINAPDFDEVEQYVLIDVETKLLQLLFNMIQKFNI